MLARGEFELDADIESDTRSLWPAADALLEAAGEGLRCMRDATRGGVATVLNELARASQVTMVVREAAVPVDAAVDGAAEMLGIDPMYVANEGKLVAFVAPERAEAALEALRAVAGLRGGSRDRRGEDGAAGDGPGGDRVRRTKGDGPARGRSVAEDLLSESGGATMAAVEFVPDQAKTEGVTAHVIWMTTGLSCDGDSVAMTSAINPSLEDIITQAIPGMPKVVVHNPVLAYEVGDEFMQAWYDAEAGKLDPFVLVVEGSIPNEEINGDGYWAGMGDDPDTGQPITTNEWVDRLAPKAAAVVALGTCATYGGIPAMKNNPTGAMGLPDYLGWKLEVERRPAGGLHPRLPGPARQHDRDAALPGDAPRRPRPGAGTRRGAAAEVAVRADRARGLQPRRLRRAGRVRDRIRLRPPLPGEARLQGAGGQMQRPGARLAERHRRLPQRRRHLHGLHDARLPRQVHAVHGRGQIRRRRRPTS